MGKSSSIKKRISIQYLRFLLHTNKYDIQVESPDGYVPVIDVVDSGPQKVAITHIRGGRSIISSPEHPHQTQDGWVAAKYLSTADKILSKKRGYVPVEDVKLLGDNIKMDMLDVLVDHPNHRFYGNGIATHNTYGVVS